MSEKGERPTFYVIDLFNLIFRAYFAMPRLSSSRGEPTGAVLGVTRMVQKIVREMKPDYIAVAMDSPGKGERGKLYEDYKAHRPPPPEDLVSQIPVIERILELFGLRTFTAPGWEADDVIASLTGKALEKGMDVRIVSSDKDLMQLVEPRVRVLFEDAKQKQVVEMDEKAVEDKYSVPPGRILDLLSMVGDKSDNIPGIPRVGQKTAADLLREFGSLDGVLENAGKIKKPALAKTVAEHRDLAVLSRDLARLNTALFEKVDFESMKPAEPDWDELRQELERMELRTLLSDMGGGEGTEAAAKAGEGDLRPSGKKDYYAVTDMGALEREVEKIGKKGTLSVDLETTGTDAAAAAIVGIALSWEKDRGCYVPVGHQDIHAQGQLPLDKVLPVLRKVLEDPRIEKYGHHIKFDDILFMRRGVVMQGIAFDTMIASYLLDPEKHQHKLDQVAMAELGYRTITYSEVTRKTRGKQLAFQDVPVSDAVQYASEDAEIVFTLVEKMRPAVEAAGLRSLLEDVELPLSRVLAEMQLVGIRIDTEYLAGVEKEFAVEMDRIEKQAWKTAGAEFNLASPKQLQEILFGKLGLAPVKKTKTGFSTDSEVLETLDHPLAKTVLDWRTLSKLLGTYVRALPEQLNPETGRIHTSYNQAVAATGRLSSSDPNLQNIPVRTERGRKIRRAFIPSKGCELMSADYSQIDLRVLAHLSGDPVLVESFRRGEDVHRRTAMEIFGVDEKNVTPEMRADSKAINFGVVYGQTDWGLSQQTGLSRRDAKDFIERYFERYRGVETYMKKVIEEAGKGQGVTTILGRRRFLRGIDSKNRTERLMAERMARNTPIQGSAADIIKLAMIKINDEIHRRGMLTRMLLNVHDELVFDVPKKEKKAAEKMVVDIMENVVKLDVPLRVDVGWGKNWADAHP
jgi:DNA polymerase-1